MAKRFYEDGNEQARKDFCETFWRNPDTYIEDLNKSQREMDGAESKLYIRKEKYSKSLYCVGINFIGLPTTEDTEGYDHNKIIGTVDFMRNNNLLLLIVGVTDYLAEPGVNPQRVTKVRKENENLWKRSTIGFSLPIDYTDIRPSKEVEKSARANIGLQIDQDLPAKLKLSVTTKCVITTQDWYNDVQDTVADVYPPDLSTNLLQTFHVARGAQLMRGLTAVLSAEGSPLLHLLP